MNTYSIILAPVSLFHSLRVEAQWVVLAISVNLDYVMN